MKTHVGVDLHQRFCYLTAFSASGELLREGQVANEAGALRGWLRSLDRPRQVVVEASGFGLRLCVRRVGKRSGW